MTFPQQQQQQEQQPLILLLIPKDLQTYAMAVGEILLQQYGLSAVSIRSVDTPVDRLLSNASSQSNNYNSSNNNNNNTLCVVLGASTSSTSTLESESPWPIITLSQHQPVPQTALAVAKCCSLASSAVRARVATQVQQNRQARLVQDAQLRTSSPSYLQTVAQCFDTQSQYTGDQSHTDTDASDATSTNRTVVRGKVRDRYDALRPHAVALVTTDRQSGFDRSLAQVPFKGAVLNLTSAFWFRHTQHIIPNHLIDVPHPYISVCRKCEPFPIEFVVRSYMTGSTSTSIWTQYKNGAREYCGHKLPDGMVKNQKLQQNLLTPTTKEADHDRPISLTDIVHENWMTQADLDVCAEAALAVFQAGQELAAQRGLILVDTKYEFGRDCETGQILLIDEVHTPDSSRYWLASTYATKIAQQQEPDNIDKEFLRLWFREHCDPYDTSVALPQAPRDLVLELARRYICLYEMITWEDFDFAAAAQAASTVSSVLEELVGGTSS